MHVGKSPARRLWLVLAPGLVTALLCGIVAVRTPLWRDEVASLSFADLSIGQLLRAITHVDAVLGPYYLVAHAALAVNEGDLWLRIPSIAAMATAALAIAEVARRWWGPIPALVAGLTMCLNPLVIQQGATARPYALATCFIALAILALVRAVDAESASGRRVVITSWVGYTLCLAAAAYLHFFAILATCSFAVLAIAARRVRPWFACTALAVLATTPLVFAAYSQRAQVNWIPHPTLRSAIGSLASVLTYRTDSRFQLLEAIALASVMLVVAVATAATLRLGPVARKREGVHLLFAVVLAAGPWALLLAISVVATPYLRTTYLTPSVLGVGLLMGALVARFPAPWPSGGLPRLGAILLSVVLVIPFFVGGYATAHVVSRRWYIDDYPVLGAALIENVEPGDSLAVVQLYNEVGVAGGVARAVSDGDYVAELQQQLVEGDQPEYGLRQVLTTQPFRTVPSAGAVHGRRVWMVYTRGAVEDEELADVFWRAFDCAAAEPQMVGSYGILRLAAAPCH